LQELQTGILLTSFSDTHFQSLVAVPLVKFTKSQKFWIAQELFYYKCPFYLPHLFKQNLKKDEFKVQVFRTFNSENIDKVFLIKENICLVLDCFEHILL
jgi:hypothetical protein